MWESCGQCRRAIVLSFVVTCLYGCAVVHVDGADIAISHTYLGLMNVSVTPRQGQATLVATEGIGIVAGAHATSLGWVHETLVMTDDLSACRVYVVIEKNNDLEQLKSALVNMNNVCIFTKEGRSWSDQQ